jgi:hypothetical protein
MDQNLLDPQAVPHGIPKTKVTRGLQLLILGNVNKWKIKAHKIKTIWNQELKGVFCI